MINKVLCVIIDAVFLFVIACTMYFAVALMYSMVSEFFDIMRFVFK